MTATVAHPVGYDAVYLSQRIRLANAVAAAVGRVFAQQYIDQAAAVDAIVPLVEAGQGHVVGLVDAYMAVKALQATGSGSVIGLDPSLYTISALRHGSDPASVYGRAFNTIGTADPDALGRAHAALDKLVRTDLQLAQTYSARDWMDEHNQAATATDRIVGYRRVLTGPGPHCALCEAAATRTYRTSDLMPIHEHCGCTVEPLWGDESVASVGTTVRVEYDPELGPRLMADSWADVGPRLL